jgi:hypothetical protein
LAVTTGILVDVNADVKRPSWSEKDVAPIDQAKAVAAVATAREFLGR